MNDNHLYICTVPAGAGKSFLGYLQAYYRDIVPYKEEADFPIGNIWDEEKPFNVWHLQQDMPMMSLPLPRATGFDVVKSQELYRDLSKNIITNTMLLQHTFPVGIEQQWKHITHEIAVNVEDIETQEFVQKLARVKGHIKNNEECLNPNKILDHEYLNRIFKINETAFELYPPNTMISYKKFFFEIDNNEIEKFLINTLPYNDINQERLDPICEMIKTYTKLNKELLNE